MAVHGTKQPYRGYFYATGRDSKFSNGVKWAIFLDSDIRAECVEASQGCFYGDNAYADAEAAARQYLDKVADGWAKLSEGL